MNTIQSQTAVLPNSSSVGNTALDASKIVKQQNSATASIGADHYSTTSANEAVVVRVLSNTLNESFSTRSSRVESNSVPHSMQLSEHTKSNSSSTFSIETVTNNVVGFVESALGNLASKGFTAEQLSYFKNEAITGVEVGIDQAKLELIGMVDDEMYKTIDKTKASIVGGINQLPVEPHEYKLMSEVNNMQINGTQSEFAAIDIYTSQGQLAKFDFETRAFNTQNNADLSSIYTTSSSTISFSINGDISEHERNKLAELTNKVDNLTSSFYRNDIQTAYDKSIELGYSDTELLNLATQNTLSGHYQQVKAYGEIQHIRDNDANNTQAPKAVANYINKYLDVIDNSKSTLASKNDFNQVINGLVNQMKDVQVPDLLQAINRFHSFNNKFN